MQVTCTNCRTQYKANESKIPVSGANVKCKKCDHDFKISSPADMAKPAESLPGSIRKSYDSPSAKSISPQIGLLNAAMTFLLWARIKENPKLHKKLKKISLQIFNKLKLHGAVIHIKDKEAIFDDFLQTIESHLLENGKITDRAVLQYINRNLKNFSPSDILKYLKIIMVYIFEDRLISGGEREALYMLGENLNISRASIDQLISKFKKDKNTSKQVIKSERIISGKQKLLVCLACFIGFLAIGVTALGYYQFQKAESAFSDFNLQVFVEENPKLVFKKIYFSKYIIYGKPEGTNNKFEKLYIYLANGYADFQFDLSKLALNEEETDFVTKTLVLSYSGELPIEVDVNIPQKDFVKIDELEAEPISKTEAASMSKLATIPAAIAGGYAGAKLGGMIGGAVYKVPIVGSAIGGIAGSVIGSGAAATGAYLMTKNFLTDLQLESNSVAESDKLYGPAKQLIAMELMGGSLLTSDNWDEDIKLFYQKDLENRIRDLFKTYGWENIRIEYQL